MRTENNSVYEDCLPVAQELEINKRPVDQISTPSEEVTTRQRERIITKGLLPKAVRECARKRHITTVKEKAAGE